jgi:hypothetical protein
VSLSGNPILTSVRHRSGPCSHACHLAFSHAGPSMNACRAAGLPIYSQGPLRGVTGVCSLWHWGTLARCWPRAHAPGEAYQSSWQRGKREPLAWVHRWGLGGH